MPAALSKLDPLPYNCYELFHTWNPSCNGAILDLLFTVLRQSFQMYSTLYFITLLLRNRGLSKRSVKQALFDSLRSTVFLTVNGLGYLSAFCLIRRVIPFNFWSISFIPCLVGSTAALLCEKPSRHTVLALYVCNVASETLFKMAVSRGYLRSIPFGEVLLFSGTMAAYMYYYRKRTARKDVVSSLLDFVLGTSETKIGNPAVSSTNELLNTENAPKKLGCEKPLYLGGAMIPVQKWLTWLQNLPRHECCPHPDSCVHYVLMGTLKPFFWGYVIQFGVNLFGSIPRFLTQPVKTVNIIRRKTNFKLALFLGSFAYIFKTVSCLLRWYNNKDRAAYAIPAGFLSGFSFVFFRSGSIASYCVWKLIELLYRKEMEKGNLPNVKGGILVLYSISTAILFHTAVVEPHNLRPGYIKFLNKMSGGIMDRFNRSLMDVYGVGSTKKFGFVWPDYDYRFVSSHLLQFMKENGIVPATKQLGGLD